MASECAAVPTRRCPKRHTRVVPRKRINQCHHHQSRRANVATGGHATCGPAGRRTYSASVPSHLLPPMCMRTQQPALRHLTPARATGSPGLLLSRCTYSTRLTAHLPISLTAPLRGRCAEGPTESPPHPFQLGAVRSRSSGQVWASICARA